MLKEEEEESSRRLSLAFSSCHQKYHNTLTSRRWSKGIKLGGKQNFRVKIRVVFSPLTLAFIRNGKIPDNKRIRIDNKNFMNKVVLD